MKLTRVEEIQVMLILKRKIIDNNKSLNKIKESSMVTDIYNKMKVMLREENKDLEIIVNKLDNK